MIFSSDAHRTAIVFALLAVSALAPDFGSTRIAVADQQPPSAQPLSPEAALQAFRLHDAVRIELAACEPQIVDPVAVRFDERGRMWVVEMRDYPHGPAEGEKPKSRIKVLEDRDGDGFFETATIFADELLFATGIQPWRKGVFVTMAGQVAYLSDEDGDGRADSRETWFTGFAQENSQLRANHPRLGLDNHIYVANGLRGGTVVDARRADAEPLSISGMDFRFDPLSNRYDAVSGVGQFGLTFDVFGNRFVCSNRNPLKHIVLADRYIRQNPAARIPATSHDVATAGAASRVFPISRAWTTSNLHAGQFTAACGVMIYRGQRLPPEFHGNGFTCDPTGNLVHRELLQPQGATFSSRPAREGVEFLASTDEWFRPVNLELGPDDELYVVDMYRAVIEHPQFMPAELKERPDLYHGVDRGRIYRIVPPDQPGSSEAGHEHLDEQTSAQLVRVIGDRAARQWQRETAARLLLERQDKAVQADLEAIVKRSGDSPIRVNALWLLAGLSALDDDFVASLVASERDPRVLEHAVALAEHFLEDRPDVLTAIRRLADHEDARLRFQVALSLSIAGDAGDADHVETLASIALRGRDDPWTRHAVVLAAGENAAAIAKIVLADARSDEVLSFSRELMPLIAQSSEAEQMAFLEFIARLPQSETSLAFRTALLHAFAESRARNRKSLAAIVDDKTKPLVDQLFRDAEMAAADQTAEISARIHAIALLAFSEAAADRLAEIARRDPNQTVRVAAIDALSRTSHETLWQDLLADFRRESPTVRNAILDGVLARTSRIGLLIAEIEAGRIKPGEIDQLRINRILRTSDTALRARANKALASAVPEDRKKVLADYQQVVDMSADPKRGAEVFRKNCATCHRVGDIGVNVAPDISDSRTKQPLQILTDVIQPNRSIDGNYVSYSAVTTDGRIITGVIAAETSGTVTLKQPEGKSVTLARSDIEELRSNGISLMPEGLEKNIPHQQMADLIAFIKNWRYLDGRTPLGDGQ